MDFGMLPQTTTSSLSLDNENNENKFNLEAERLRTFNNWNVEFINKNILALSGMYYTQINDIVKCHFCKIQLKNWEYGDDPIHEHFKWSRHCVLLHFPHKTNNVPIDVNELKRLLPVVRSFDVCGNNDPYGNEITVDDDPSPPIEVRWGAFPEDPITQRQLQTPSPTLSSSSSSAATADLTNRFGRLFTENNAGSGTDIKPEIICKICFIRQSNTVFIPCGHVVACLKCANLLKDQCPICRMPVTKIQNLYYS